jgi:cardiolipin synthase
MNAAKRGVNVIIITPFIPDKKLVYELTKNSYRQLMNANVKIYEFTPGFMHAKNLIIDDKYAICGTINFDYRSLIHHYENAVWMYSSKCIAKMKDDFTTTLDNSILQTEQSIYQKPLIKLFVGIIKIFASFF